MLLEGRFDLDADGVDVIPVRSDAGVFVDAVVDTSVAVGAGEGGYVDDPAFEVGLANRVVLRRTCTEFRDLSGVGG